MNEKRIRKIYYAAQQHIIMYENVFFILIFIKDHIHISINTRKID